MVFEELINAAPELAEPLASIAFFTKILGGIAGIWFILWIVSFALNLRRAVLLKKMLKKLDENDQKLEALLNKRK